jgi:iron(III) transport system substrate-binding protein
VGGSSVSADPISLLRGAEHRELAVRFIEFVLTDGQKLWNYRPGAPGGPRKYALRRLPIRRDFYPSDDPVVDAAYKSHSVYTVDVLGDPDVNPYALAAQFTYQPRWTAGHFGILRDLVRAMCLDSGEELCAAWRAISENGGPAAQPEAMAALERLPTQPPELTWLAALEVPRKFQPLDYMRAWTVFFRGSYREAGALVKERGERR